jgi:protein associated with RNAse G/E
MPAVFCAPRTGWWHLHYEGRGAREYSAFVDIVTPPVWVSDSRYEMIDLDLDVAVRQDGTIEVQDEDEFEIHKVKYGYTDEMIRGAIDVTERVVNALEGRQEPFFEVADTWLERVKTASGTD